MKKINVKYVAKVEIFSSIDESTYGLKPYEGIARGIKEQFTPSLKDMLEYEIGPGTVVNITPEIIDVYETEESE